MRPCVRLYVLPRLHSLVLQVSRVRFLIVAYRRCTSAFLYCLGPFSSFCFASSVPRSAYRQGCRVRLLPRISLEPRILLFRSVSTTTTTCLQILTFVLIHDHNRSLSHSLQIPIASGNEYCNVAHASCAGRKRSQRAVIPDKGNKDKPGRRYHPQSSIVEALRISHQSSSRTEAKDCRNMQQQRRGGRLSAAADEQLSTVLVTAYRHLE